jgi:hypothetical protein
MPFATHRSQQIHYTVEGAGPLAGGAVIQGGLAASTPAETPIFQRYRPKADIGISTFFDRCQTADETSAGVQRLLPIG